MKKLMMLALGAGLALGTVSFAQDTKTPASGTMSGDTTTKPKKTKKAKKTKTPPATDSTMAPAPK
jgi:hypothetical protein